MKKILTLFACIATAILATNAQEVAEQKFNQDGWGVSVQGKFNLENPPELIGSYYNPETGEFSGTGIDHLSDTWSIGATFFYVWHPLQNCTPSFAKHFFTQFGLGGEYYRIGSYSEGKFLFNARVILGYTFQVKNVGLDVFTGPVGRFAPEVRKSFASIGTGNNKETVPVKNYYGGAEWRFGIGLNIQRFGLFVAYNQPMGGFDHWWLNKKHNCMKVNKNMTVGVQVRF